MQKHILYITQYYFTGEDIGSQRSHRNVEYLVNQGYKVSLVTTYVNMLTTQVPERYKKHDGKRISIEKVSDNLTIYFVDSARNFKKSFWSRANSFLSFSINALVAALKVKDINLVVGSGPPIFSCAFGYLVARLRKAKFIYEVRDLWPEALLIGKTNTNKLIHSLIWNIDLYLCKKADKIIVLNRGIKERVLLRGVEDSKVILIPNGAHLDLFEADKYTDIYPESIVRDNNNQFIVTYAGNHSIVYAIEDIIRAAKKLQEDYPEIKFVLVGDGYHKKTLQEIAEKENITNLQFYPPQPRNSIPEILFSSNLCLLTCKEEEYMKWSFGNKILDYMSSGRPLVLSFCKSESTDVVENNNCGLVSEPGNIDKICEHIVFLYKNTNLAKEMGKNGRKFVETYYDSKKLLDVYGKLIQDVLE